MDVKCLVVLTRHYAAKRVNLFIGFNFIKLNPIFEYSYKMKHSIEAVLTSDGGFCVFYQKLLRRLWGLRPLLFFNTLNEFQFFLATLFQRHVYKGNHKVAKTFNFFSHYL